VLQASSSTIIIQKKDPAPTNKPATTHLKDMTNINILKFDLGGVVEDFSLMFGFLKKRFG
jgi:hypothetical protein